MGVTTTQTNKPFNPRGNDQSPLAFNRAKLYSGKALDFDGVNDSVTATGSNTLSFSEITLSAYVKFDNLSAVQVIFHKRRDVTGYQSAAFSMRANGELWFATTTGTTEYKAVYSGFVTGEFYHIVGTNDGSNNYLYINGKLVDTTASGAIDNTTTYDFVLGDYGTGSYFFNGQIANAKVFSGALTAAQVADLYNNPELVVPTGVDNTALKLWLPMMEGAGTTAYDGSGNGNHGTISGATYVHGIGAPVAQSAVIDWNKLYDFDGVDDNARITSYQDTTGTKSYKVHFIAHDVDNEGQIFQIFNFSASKGVGATIDFLGTNNGTLGMRGFVSNADYDIQSWSVEANTYYELAFTINWDTNTIISATLNGETATGSVSARLDTSNGGLCLGSRISAYFLNGIVNYFEVVGVDKWTNASGFKSQSGSYDMTISGSPTQILAPQGLTTGRDITGVNLFENVRKQGALNLDGSSFAEVHKNDSVPQGGEDRTLEVWVYYRPQTTYQSFMELGEKSNFKRFAILATSNPVGNIIYIAGQSYDTNTYVSYNTNAWNHIVVTLESTTQKIYKDGVLINTVVRDSYDTTLDTIEIGRHKQNVAEYSYSPIAQPRIYNRALTAEEVQRSYDSGKNIFTNS